VCVFVCNQYAKEACSYRALFQKRPIILQGSFAKETYGVLSCSLAAKISNLCSTCLPCVFCLCVCVCVCERESESESERVCVCVYVQSLWGGFG